MELTAVLEVEEAVGLGESGDGSGKGLEGLGIEEGDYALRRRLRQQRCRRG